MSLALLVIVAAIVRLARVTQFNTSSDQFCELFCLLVDVLLMQRRVILFRITVFRRITMILVYLTKSM